MINILDNIYGGLVDYDMEYIGNKIYIKLDGNRRIELSFYNTFSVDNYDSIKLVLIHKHNGQLHSQLVKFSDIFECMQDLKHPNKIGKHIWHNNGYSWYGKPTKEDVNAMKQVLIDYVDLWK